MTRYRLTDPEIRSAMELASDAFATDPKLRSMSVPVTGGWAVFVNDRRGPLWVGVHPTLEAAQAELETLDEEPGLTVRDS